MLCSESGQLWTVENVVGHGSAQHLLTNPCEEVHASTLHLLRPTKTTQRSPFRPLTFTDVRGTSRDGPAKDSGEVDLTFSLLIMSKLFLL